MRPLQFLKPPEKRLGESLAGEPPRELPCVMAGSGLQLLEGVGRARWGESCGPELDPEPRLQRVPHLPPPPQGPGGCTWQGAARGQSGGSREVTDTGAKPATEADTSEITPVPWGGSACCCWCLEISVTAVVRWELLTSDNAWGRGTCRGTGRVRKKGSQRLGVGVGMGGDIPVSSRLCVTQDWSESPPCHLLAL